MGKEKDFSNHKLIDVSFDCDKQFYDDERIDVIATGFNRVLNSLYDAGILTHKPVKAKGEFKKYKNKPEKMEFEFHFEKV